jgi:hypothetical protein
MDCSAHACEAIKQHAISSIVLKVKLELHRSCTLDGFQKEHVSVKGKET